MGTVICLLQHR